MSKKINPQREYLFEKTRKLVGNHEPHLDRISAICYLYGGEMGYSTLGVWDKKIRKDWDDVLRVAIEPWAKVLAAGKPLLQYQNEEVIVPREIARLGRETIHAYLNWGTKEGDETRKEIDALLEKQPKTDEYKAWESAHKKFFKLFGTWVDAYEKQYPKNIIKFFDYKQYIAITVKKLQPNKPRHTMSKDEKFKIWSKYRDEVNQFATFLEEGFLSEEKLFSKRAWK